MVKGIYFLCCGVVSFDATSLKKTHFAAHRSRTCVIYLVDPASGICLSQGLSHASVSMRNIIQRNCEWLGKTAIISSMLILYG